MLFFFIVYMNQLISSALFSGRIIGDARPRQPHVLDSLYIQPHGNVRYPVKNMATNFRRIDPHGTRAIALVRSLGY